MKDTKMRPNQAPTEPQQESHPARHFAPALAICLALLGSTAAHAQSPVAGLLPSSSKALANKPAQVAKASPDNPRAQAEAQLEEARQQQSAERLENPKQSDSDKQPLSDLQRSLDILVLAYGERIEALDSLDAYKQLPPKKPETQALIDEFTAPPPYSAVRIDLLRNEQDALKQRLNSLHSAEHAFESEKRALIDNQRRAAEAVRLGDDKVARAANEKSAEQETKKRQLAVLHKKIAEANLTNVGVGLERVSLEIKNLNGIQIEIKSVLDRVIPAQQLTKEELARQQSRLNDDLTRVKTEIDRRLAENTRRMAERERLIKSNIGAAERKDQSQKIKLIDEQLTTDRMVLATTNWIKSLIEMTIDNWALRYAGLNSKDVATRESAITGLKAAKASIENRQQLFQELEVSTRTEVNDQEIRLKEALLDLDATRHESAILDLIKQRAMSFQRAELGNARAIRVIDRWLNDLGAVTSVEVSDQWAFRQQQVSRLFKDIWNFEMFAVEDATLIDGKTVTTTYGVTVGKSIGSLFLFALAYWFASFLLRRFERIMVRRFGVNEQLASVIRRWSLIALALLLIILILNLARIPLTAFAFMGGALAIGIGFGTQTIIKNVISGIIILFERKIRVGDIISLGGTTGYVTHVDLRASTLRGFDGIEALVPNSTLLENQVTNWTYSNHNIRREIRIGVAYGAPVHDAAEIILNCAKDHGQVRKDPPPEVFFEDFGDNALLMVLVFWVELGPNMVSRRVDSDLRYAMEKRLAAAGIGIPFPQRTIHLNLADALPVRQEPPVTAP